MHIGIPFSILIFAFMFADTITGNWVMYRACYVTLGFNRSECALLGSKHQDNYTQKLEQKVQPYATVIGMVRTLLEAFTTAILCFFVGPWSDKYGRKPVLLMTFAGYTLSYLIIAVISVIPDLSPWFILLSVIPLCFTGGIMAVFTAALCYINDLTLSENRGIRLAIFYAIAAAGSLVGSLSSSYALHIFGYFVVYLIAASCIFLAWLTVFLFLQESISNPSTEGKLANLFKISLVCETMKAAFKKRDSHNRGLMFTITGILILYLLAFNSSGLMFLYVRGKFHWSLQAYTIYTSVDTVAETVGTTLGIYCLLRFLRMRESWVVLTGLISLLCGALTFGLATRSWHIYVGAILKCLGGSVSPLSRSLLSQLVPPDEYGKVFSFVAICESLIGPLGAPLYTLIYNKTLVAFPGAFSLVSVAVYSVAAALSIVVIVVKRRQEQSSYAVLHEEDSVQ